MNKSERLNDMMIYLINKTTGELFVSSEWRNIISQEVLQLETSNLWNRLECQYFQNMAGMEDMEY